jgi:hypothetical protein
MAPMPAYLAQNAYSVVKEQLTALACRALELSCEQSSHLYAITRRKWRVLWGRCRLKRIVELEAQNFQEDLAIFAVWIPEMGKEDWLNPLPSPDFFAAIPNSLTGRSLY